MGLRFGTILLFAAFLAVIIPDSALCSPMDTVGVVDSVWFSEETDCDGVNLVHICYSLSGATADISASLSSDGGVFWHTAGTGCFTTFSDAVGDLGSGVVPGIHCFDWHMSTDLPGVEGSDFKIRIATFSNSCDYWLPWTLDYSGCASGHASRIYLRGQFDSTDVDVDFDNDGAIDTSFTLDENEGISFTDAFIQVGTHARSTGPLQAYYMFYCSNHSLYEDGSLSYALYPSSMSGTDFAVFPADYTTVFAIADGTTINVDSDYSGTVDFSFVLDSGEDTTFSTASGPAHIYSGSGKKIIVVNAFHSSDCYSTTGAYNLLPTELIGNEYHAPAVHPYSLAVNSLNSRAEVIATQPGTNLTINGTPYTPAVGELTTAVTEAEIDISADRPVAATYISDIDATDPWGSHVHRRYMYAFQLFPAGRLSERYVLPAIGSSTTHGYPKNRYCIASFSDGNTIDIDVSGDGSIDTSFVLDDGDISCLHEGDYPPFTSNFIELLSSAPVQVTHSRRGWWSSTSETCDGKLILSGNIPNIAEHSGIMDSKPPEIDLICPTGPVFSGEDYEFRWLVVDSFPSSEDCSLFVISDFAAETVLVGGSSYIWEVLPSCDSARAIVAVRDSFCNWGYDTCGFAVCNPMMVRIRCAPCGAVTSCSNQSIFFTVADTLCGEWLSSAFLTVKIFDMAGDSTVHHYIGPSSEVRLIPFGTDSTSVILEGIPYADGDSVWFSLDSLIDSRGCTTEF